MLTVRHQLRDSPIGHMHNGCIHCQINLVYQAMQSGGWAQSIDRPGYLMRDELLKLVEKQIYLRLGTNCNPEIITDPRGIEMADVDSSCPKLLG